SVAECCRQAIHVLAQYPNDLPFAALYLVDGNEAGARRVAVSRELPESWFPALLDLAPGRNPWQLHEPRAESLRMHLTGLSERGLQLPAGPWPDHIQQALVLPLMGTGQERPVGFLIAAVSPRRAFDEAYASFLELIASQVASAV